MENGYVVALRRIMETTSIVHGQLLKRGTYRVAMDECYDEGVELLIPNLDDKVVLVKDIVDDRYQVK